MSIENYSQIEDVAAETHDIEKDIHRSLYKCPECGYYLHKPANADDVFFCVRCGENRVFIRIT